MARSQHLRLRELRDLYLLVGECCELGADPLAWRRRMVTGLLRLLEGQVGIYMEYSQLKSHGQDGWLVPLLVVDAGWPTPSDRRPLEQFIRRNRPELCPWFSARHYQTIFHPAGGLATVPREKLIDDRKWYRSEFFTDYLQWTHLDASLVASRPEANAETWGIAVHRALGEERFEPRQRRLLRLFFREQSRLVETRLARRGALSVLELPPRLREVLRGLMAGQGEKQLASQLGISPHTVHYHVKQLHQRFGASSRGELLAKARALRTDLDYPGAG